MRRFVGLRLTEALPDETTMNDQGQHPVSLGAAPAGNIGVASANALDNRISLDGSPSTV